MRIILLSGGKSTRFSPLSNKNYYKFLGKNSIEHRLEQVRKYFQTESIYLVVDQVDEIITNLTSNYSNIEVLKQIGEGQHGAVKTVLDRFDSNDSLLIINVNDYFEDRLFEEFAGLDKSRNYLTAYKTEKYFPGGYLEIDSERNVHKIVEKPGAGNEPSDYVRLVFDFFQSSEVLRGSLIGADSSKDDKYEVAIQNMINQGSNFKMIDYQGKWFFIKYPWHVLNLMDYLLEGMNGQSIHQSVSIAPTAVINGNVIIEEGVKILDGAIINGPVYIGKNSLIANHTLVRSSIIGDNCIVGFGSEVARSYLGDNSVLHNNYFGDSVVEGDSSFGAGTITGNYRFDSKSVVVNVNDQKIDSDRAKLGAFVGKNVRTGIGTLIMPGVKVGANSIISAGVVVNRDVEAESFVKNLNTVEIIPNTK
jgi:UDP-N-acetylglucosamine diphosphorylase / glucose-1-phosphate thymidylyltransferase / UDP-N-acetylgalactosamine diphosphorylase / glucosamine-1-phosphate N-acetyltransferase / galactosamine-1-phosphate N-acetyltransferase